MKKYSVELFNLTDQSGQTEDVIRETTANGETTTISTQSGQRSVLSARSTAYLGWGNDFKVDGEFKVSGGSVLPPILPNLDLNISPRFRGKLQAGMTLDALYRLKAFQRRVTLFRTPVEAAPRVAFPIGPIPLWIAYFFDFPYQAEAGIDLCLTEGVVGFEAGFVGNASVGTSRINGRSQQYLKPVVNGSGQVNGRVSISVQPSLDALIYDAVGIKLKLVAEAIGETIPNSNTVIFIDEPVNNSVLKLSEEVDFAVQSLPTGSGMGQIGSTDRIELTRELRATGSIAFAPAIGQLSNSLRRAFPLIGRLGANKVNSFLEKIQRDITLAGPVRRRLGSLDLPKGLPVGCSRFLWKDNGENLFLDRANRTAPPLTRSFTLPAGSLSPGSHRISVRAFSPWSNKPVSNTAETTITVD